MKLTFPPGLGRASPYSPAARHSPGQSGMNRTFISATGLATAMLLPNEAEMKDYLFCAVIVAVVIGFPYLIFLTIREKWQCSALTRKPQLPRSPAPPVERRSSAQTPPPLSIKPPEIASLDEEIPEFMDRSPEDFAIYFEAYERERAILLGLKPGEPVPPLNSKALRRKP
jgi:hypothetical protein